MTKTEKIQAECVSVNCNGEELLLSNLRCAYWQRHRMIILSDLHLGKTAHFRKNGIPIPNNVLYGDLHLLDTAISFFKAEKIMVVGDMFHHYANTDITSFEAWRKERPHIEIAMVKGNHDRIHDSLCENLNIQVVGKTINIDGICFSHHHHCNELFVVSGHIHPGITIAGKGGQLIKLPAFIKSSQMLVLPAFSKFTGLDLRFANDEEVEKFGFTNTSIFKI